jgi:LCP family protein required for cell wall assembly
MADNPRNQIPTQDPPYRVYRGGGGRGGRDDGPSDPRGPREPGRRSGRAGAGGAGGAGAGAPYTRYRSGPRGLLSRLRGEDDLIRPGDPGGGRRAGRGQGGRRGLGLSRPWWRRRPTPLRALALLVGLIVAWLLLSLVLFVVSASENSGSVPANLSSALASGPNMITGTDTILVIGTDQRPPGSKEPGAFAGGIRSDTMMLWRIGGGTSRRLSIPRDTNVQIPGYGITKINAAYSYGGPALAVRTVDKLTGVQINHIIIVNLANFPKFIDDIGGVTVKTGRICSDISGGVKNGGFSLYLKPGVHHLDGRDALTLARTRENKCDAASNDLTREGYQQKILNGIKSQLLTPATFFHLPWASWDAPRAVRTDMGGPTLLELFVAAEIGGSAPTKILGQNNLPLPDAYSSSGQAAIHRAINQLMNG